MTTFSIGQVQVITSRDEDPEAPLVSHIVTEMINNINLLLTHELQGDVRDEVAAILTDGLYQAQNHIIRKAF